MGSIVSHQVYIIIGDQQPLYSILAINYIKYVTIMNFLNYHYKTSFENGIIVFPGCFQLTCNLLIIHYETWGSAISIIVQIVWVSREKVRGT